MTDTEYILMNGDREILYMDLDEGMIQVLDNKFLPYPLKDFVKTTGEKDFRHSIADINIASSYLIGRTLSLERENAKMILEMADLPQSLRPDQKLKIVYACRGLTMEDNFWLKKPEENIRFSDVDLRRHHLSDASYDIAILGKPVSATRKELRPDIGTAGMFPKFWRRTDGTVELWKTDRSDGANADAEVKSSVWLKGIGIKTAEYHTEEIDGRKFSVTPCFTDEKHSLVTALDVSDYCNHTGKDFKAFVRTFPEFYDMAVADYILANTDRHIENWGFIVDNGSNEIMSFAPLYDHNQCLIADSFGTDIGTLIYEPTGKPFKESVSLADKGTVKWQDISAAGLTKGAAERLAVVQEHIRQEDRADLCSISLADRKEKAEDDCRDKSISGEKAITGRDKGGESI